MYTSRPSLKHLCKCLWLFCRYLYAWYTKIMLTFWHAWWVLRKRDSGWVHPGAGADGQARGCNPTHWVSEERQYQSPPDAGAKGVADLSYKQGTKGLNVVLQMKSKYHSWKLSLPNWMNCPSKLRSFKTTMIWLPSGAGSVHRLTSQPFISYLKHWEKRVNVKLVRKSNGEGGWSDGLDHYS